MTSETKKYYTFFVVPEKTSRIYKFRIPQHVFFGMLGGLLLFFMFFGYAIYSSMNRYVEVSEYALLKEQNKKHETQINEITSMIKVINARMKEINRYNDKIKDVANIQDNPPSEENLFSLGGSSPSAGENGIDLSKNTNEIASELSKEMKNLSHTSDDQEKRLQELCSFFDGQENIIASTPAVFPTRGFLVSSFGYRRDPFTLKSRLHEGVDIVNRTGTPITTTADGVVIFTGIKTGYGKAIIVNHGFGYYTLYGHLSNIIAKEGDMVKRGDVIGNMGSTGRSKAPHLHYEVWINGVPVDPQGYFFN